MATLTKIALSCAAATAAFMAVSTPVLAGEKTRPVYYNDLDLASAQGQQKLQVRIKSAINRVCASPRGFTLAEKADFDRCKTEAMAKAMPNAERVIAQYQETKSMAAGNKTAVVGN
ncbi:MAG: UrcA family protein [Sphingorhabdus sp.]